ncbi:MAG TPA: hypothetical protein PK625_04105 [Spirochaetales bacterium]|nr:hypothetical protein [Spirochaetales bacterium]MBP7263361.1 hypothetical protein [Spirochaetia bacterium]HPE36308.1 hypothetical protein [Spirochaetales bacterium]
MKLEINPRGNGACPLCVYDKNCRLKKKLADNVDEVNPSPDLEMEIVIYNCPYFKEKLA